MTNVKTSTQIKPKKSKKESFGERFKKIPSHDLEIMTFFVFSPMLRAFRG